MATIFSFYVWDVRWHHLVNTTELSVCGGDAALCQITLTTFVISAKKVVVCLCMFECLF